MQYFMSWKFPLFIRHKFKVGKSYGMTILVTSKKKQRIMDKNWQLDYKYMIIEVF